MQKKYDPARGHVNARAERGHQSRAQARRSRRAMMLRSRARYDRMRSGADGARRERESREMAATQLVDDMLNRPQPPWGEAPDLESEEQGVEEWRNDRQERDRELDILRSEEASRRCRERDAAEWRERFGPAARLARLASLPAGVSQ